MQSKNTITMVILCMRIYSVETFIPPTISSAPIVQTGQWNYATGDKQKGYPILYTIEFDQAFVETPNVGMILNQYDDADSGNNDLGFANYKDDIVTVGIKLTSFVLSVGVSKNTIQLSFSWIATSSQDIFILQVPALNTSAKINFKLPRTPSDLSKLQHFIYIRGGINTQGQIVTSSMDTINSFIQININGGLRAGENERFSIIVVNNEDTIDQRSHIRLLANSFTSANQKSLEINTIPVLTSHKQNIYIGLSSYYNPNSIWKFSILSIFSNQSYINYSLQFDPQSIIRLQYVQIEILNCSDLYSIFQGETCVCNPQYYQNQSTCQQCSTFCNTCSAIDQCQSCQTISNLSLKNGLCLCNTGYFIQATSCQACDITCYQCSGVSPNQCTSCDSTTLHRILNSNLCVCHSGYFQYNSQCTSCDYTCLSCSQSTTCDTCDPLTMRRNMTNSQCVCLDGFYETFNSSICQQCDITCLTCITRASQCRSCIMTNQRSIINNTCQCVDGYYEIVNQAICQQCHTPCLTCVTSATNCQTCFIDNYGYIMNNSCLCIDGYYQRVNQAMCERCDTTCQTCVTLATNCLTCLISSNRIINSHTCPCMDGYYEQDNQALCKKCHITCLNCQGPDQNQCFKCDSNRIMTSDRCLCLTGTYNDFSDVCQACHFTCQGCSGPLENECKTCGEINIVKRLMNSSICSCEQGYYTIQDAAICQQCHPRCKTCEGGMKNNCLTCLVQQNRELIGSQCICQTEYYQLQDQQLCVPCLNKCIQCPLQTNVSQYFDINCECNQDCVTNQNKIRKTVKSLDSIYNYTQNVPAVGKTVGTIEFIGLLGMIFRTRQMILTTLILDFNRAETVFALQRQINIIKKRVLSKFLFKATIFSDQNQGNLTSIICFESLDVTSQAMIQQTNPHLRLLGLSELIIYTAMQQLVLLGAIITLLILMKGLSLILRSQNDLIQQINTFVIGFAHMVFEGFFLYLFPQILMNFKYLVTQGEINLQKIEFIASLTVSLVIFTFYLGYLTKTFYDIYNHMKRKIRMTECEQASFQYQLEEDKFIKGYSFYLYNNPMKTTSQALFTVLSQFKKIIFSFIIVFGAAQVQIQLFMFFTLGNIFLFYYLIAIPKKNKMQFIILIDRIRILDLVIQTLFLVYVISTIIDFQQVRNDNIRILSADLTFQLIIIILSIDMVKILYNILSSIIIRYNERKNKQQELKTQNIYKCDNVELVKYDVCQDYTF